MVLGIMIPHEADDSLLTEMGAAEARCSLADWVTEVSLPCCFAFSGILTVCGARLLSHDLTICAESNKKYKVMFK